MYYTNKGIYTHLKQIQMKTFKDLEFKPHTMGSGLQAVMNFDNDYGVSVIRFYGSYGYERGLWEVAIFYKGEISYNTSLTDDVLGHQTEQDVTDVMIKVQSFT